MLKINSSCLKPIVHAWFNGSSQKRPKQRLVSFVCVYYYSYRAILVRPLYAILPKTLCEGVFEMTTKVTTMNLSK